MKTIDEIRAFWSALPGATYFANAFQAAIGAVEVADVDARAAEEEALAARGRHRRALHQLREKVEAEAAADWTPEEIESARGASLRFSLAAAHSFTR
jgi:hypothetical protein